MSPERIPRAMPSGGEAGRPAIHQTAMPAGMIPTDAATIPTVAARNGSPAVLRRTFHATWRTPLSATSAMTIGSIAATVPARRVTALDGDEGDREGADCLGVQVAPPEADDPEADPAHRKDQRCHDPDGIPLTE